MVYKFHPWSITEIWPLEIGNLWKTPSIDAGQWEKKHIPRRQKVHRPPEIGASFWEGPPFSMGIDLDPTDINRWFLSTFVPSKTGHVFVGGYSTCRGHVKHPSRRWSNHAAYQMQLTFSGLWLNPTPLKNMSPSIGMMTFPTEWTNTSHVPNHQPEKKKCNGGKTIITHLQAYHKQVL